jgi:hypothetical protein
MKMNRQELYEAVVFDGAAVECNGISLCNLENVMNTNIGVPRAKYQVWSDKARFYGLFHNIQDAVRKFVELNEFYEFQ